MAAVEAPSSWYDRRRNNGFSIPDSKIIEWSDDDTTIRLSQIAVAWVTLCSARDEARHLERSEVRKVSLTFDFVSFACLLLEWLRMQQRLEP